MARWARWQAATGRSSSGPGPDAVLVDGVRAAAPAAACGCARAPGGGRLRHRARRARRRWSRRSSEDMEGEVQLGRHRRGRPRARPRRRAPAGHRFFFAPEEVEPLRTEPAPLTAPASSSPASATCSWATTASASRSPAGSRARELPPGSRSPTSASAGMDLAYALGDYDVGDPASTPSPRGEPPGTLYVIEPELGDEPSRRSTRTAWTRSQVLALARTLGGTAAARRSSSAASRRRA